MMRHGQADTRALRLECVGLTVGDFSVPPFSVSAGQAVCLHVPPGSTAAGWDELLEILNGRATHPGFRIQGSFGRLDRPIARRRWWGGLSDPAALDWLVGPAGLTPEEAARVLVQLAMPARLRVGRIGWNAG